MIPIIRTGMASASKDMAVISHNIANGATNGFKRSNAQFEDAYPTGLPGNVVPGMGSRDVAPRRSHAPGAIRTTGQVLDMAVLGQGMFVLGPASGEGRESFTRNGSFQIDQQGFITTPIGQPVLSTEGLPIRVPTAVTSEGGTTAELSALSIDASGLRGVAGEPRGVAHALGAGFEGRQVRAGARFAVALAPPDLAAGDAGQKALLLLGVAKGHDDGGHHHGAKRHHAGGTGQGAFFFKQVFLDG